MDRWSKAFQRQIEPDGRVHSLDTNGCTPLTYALRSPFAFLVLREAVGLHDAEDYVKEELKVCSILTNQGWKIDSLVILFHLMTKERYFESAQWYGYKDKPSEMGYAKSPWLSLLDILRHRCHIPSDWSVQAHPRRFNTPRQIRYGRASDQSLAIERPKGGDAIFKDGPSESCYFNEVVEMLLDWGEY